jgi:undecaprenyl-phosphate galactose phosphotransferase
MNAELELATDELVILYDKKISQYVFMFFKRVFDILCSLVGLVVLIPLMIIVKITYVLSGDMHSIFYTQNRVGMNGKIFKLYKFRTMVPNADEMLKEILKDPLRRREWRLTQKLHNDPRVTKMGRILRKTSLDEMPQMLNVLKGDMSIIGPRPLIINELDSHNGSHIIYESVKPGLTGWWAVNGRSNVEDYGERLELEYYYVNNRSVKLDFLVLVKTVSVLIKREGSK